MKFLVVVFAVCAAVVSAEAEAEADASAQFYGGYAGYSPYAYRPYAAYGYGGYAPLAYGYGGAYGYGAGYGYNAYGYGGHFIGKREAEAEAAPEADAQVALGYSALPYAYSPYAYAARPYAYAPYAWAPAASSYQYQATPFAQSSLSQVHPGAALVHGLFKREAEAEPEADAQVALGYAALPYAYRPVGVAAHPGFPYASAYEYRSPQGLNAYNAYPWGYAGAYYGRFF